MSASTIEFVNSEATAPQNTSTASLNDPVEIFFSYAHTDERLRDDLAKHLKVLKRQRVITDWHDRQIVAGAPWADAIDQHLNSARVILLLISPDFLASNYCMGIEVKRAMERHENGEAQVIPVILRPSYWMVESFGRLEALPKNARPVTTWVRRDEAFLSVVEGIVNAISSLTPTATPHPASIATTISTSAFAPNGATKTQLRIEANFDEFDATKVSEILALLRRLTGDDGLDIKEIKPGSVILTIECSEEALNRLNELVDNGVLAEHAGFEITISKVNELTYGYDQSASSDNATELGGRLADFVEELKSEKSMVRRSAAKSLGDMGAEARPAVPALIDALLHTDAGLRRTSASSLGKIGTKAVEAVPALTRAMNDSDKRVRLVSRAAIDAIRERALNLTVPYIAQALTGGNTDVRYRSALLLALIGPEASAAVPSLMAALNDRDASVRLGAADALVQIGSGAVPSLIEALKDRDTNVRLGAADALKRMSANVRDEVASLIEALKDKNAKIRSASIVTLGRLGAESKEAVPLIIEALRDGDSSVRLVAVEALARLNLEPKEAVPAFIEALRDSDGSVRLSASRALRDLGPAAKEAEPELIVALGDKNPSVRLSAVDALGGMGIVAKEAASAIIEAVHDEDRSVRMTVVKVLRILGGEAKGVVPAFIEAIKDKDEHVRLNASRALREMGAGAKDAKPALIEALKDSNAYVRLNAEAALKAIKEEE